MDHAPEELMRRMGRSNGLPHPHDNQNAPKPKVVRRHLEQSAEVIRDRGGSDETRYYYQLCGLSSLSPTRSWRNSVKHSPVHHAFSVCRSSLSCMYQADGYHVSKSYQNPCSLFARRRCPCRISDTPHRLFIANLFLLFT